MAKTYQPPTSVEMSAMKNKKKLDFDLMRPGNGTPWEDRGEQGVIGGFLKTSVQSITRPILLLDHIRRPDTTADANGFAWLCAIMWGLSVLIHKILLLFYLQNDKTVAVDTNIYYLNTAVQVLATPVAVYLLLRFFCGMYLKLVATELRSGSAPPQLIFNVFAYSLGPSILALIPVAGIPLALLLIFVVSVIAGTRRLFISGRGAFVASLLSLGAALGLLAATYFVGQFLWENVIMGPSVTEHKVFQSRPTF